MQLRSRFVDDDKQHILAELIGDALGRRLNLSFADTVRIDSVQIDVEDMDAVQLGDALRRGGQGDSGRRAGEAYLAGGRLEVQHLNE